MGCLFGCFRVRSDNRCPPRTHLVSEPAVSRSRRNVTSPNQFTSLLVSEEHDQSPCTDGPNQSSRFQQTEITDRDLQDEAKFLKACGVLVETPAEIRKSRVKLEHSEEQGLDSGSPKFHSWYPNTSVEKLILKNEGRSQSSKPLTLCEECQDSVSSSKHSTDSCVAEMCDKGDSLTVDTKSQLVSLTSSNKIQDNELDHSPGLNSPQLSSEAVKSRAKSVHFACEPETPMRSSSNFLSEKVGQSCYKAETQSYPGVLKYSPHPTPLKLSDEMQTPGTIYAANLDSATKDRTARIRSQYVYAAFNPVEDISQRRILKKEAGEGETNNDAFQLPGSAIKSSERLYDTPSHSSGKDNKVLDDNDLKLEASLSVWLRAPPSTTDKNTESHEVVHTRNLGLTPGSRPILGVLPASYFNRDRSSDMRLKCWDGNGIPNTTTKYKEDQKVKWHATPFEERLEKALSAESSIPDRRHMDGIPIVYKDKEDESSDSPFQSSTLSTEADLPFLGHHIDMVS
ncbi:unnamed protein product [Rhodiola kirilowii]